MKIYHAMPQRSKPEADAVWVGELNLAAYVELPSPEDIELVGAEAYPRAKLLLRDGYRVVRFMDVPLIEGQLPTDFRERAIAGYLPEAAPQLRTFPQFTVAISTRERTEDLRQALETILRLDYPNFEVVVVDNAPETDATRRMLADRFPGVRYVLEPRKGLSIARNTALAQASGEYVAFTDDDVAVDSQWLRALLAGFNGAEDIECVTGLVPSGELATKAQRYFDSRVTWSRNILAQTYRRRERYEDLPTFPFSVGAFGTGANFAVRRNSKLKFDTALGAGRPTGGGEDIDFFFRVLLSGKALAVCPDALVWHRHRSSESDLSKQALTYGSGLGAWLMKLLLTPAAWPLLPPRMLAGFKSAQRLGSSAKAHGQVALDEELDALVRATEKRAIFSGPLLYLRERRRAVFA